MTPPATLELAAARVVQLATLGLVQPPATPATPAAVAATLRRLHLIQIDTIHVVARSPYLVLWSRLGDYAPHWLDELLPTRQMFEYWAHEASFLPMADYPLYRRLMLGKHKGWRETHTWLANHPDTVAHVLQRIHATGAVRSADFVRRDGRSSTGWWDWKDEKIALDYLHTRGDLMITHRHNFQRYYDLRERVVPDWDDAHAPPLEEVYTTLTQRAVETLGISQERWLADYFRMPQAATRTALRQLLAAGTVLPVRVAEWDSPGYVARSNLPLLDAAATGTLQPTHCTLLSPFDPLVWDRARVRAMFDFDYRIESYTPAAKRRYGYFSLPILWRGALIGRLDPKAHRKQGVLEIKALYLEPWVQPDADLGSGLAHLLQAFAQWHGTSTIRIQMSDPPELAAVLQKEIGE